LHRPHASPRFGQKKKKERKKRARLLIFFTERERESFCRAIIVSQRRDLNKDDYLMLSRLCVCFAVEIL
jgi:hypothetical protein